MMLMLGAASFFLIRPEVWIAALGLAAFLTLFWVLRGAPLGHAAREETDAGAPAAGYRDRVVAAAVAALLLIAAGAYIAIRISIPWSLVPFALGYGSLITLVRVNARYRHSSPILRRVLQFSDFALNGSLMAGILIVGNALAFKYGERPFDLTSERAFTLESLSRHQLKSLDRPVRFTVVYGNNRITQRQVNRVVQLLDLYREENPRFVQFDLIGAYSEPIRFEELVRKVPDVAIAARQGGGVVIEYGEGEGAQRLVVRNSEMFEFADSEGDSSRFHTNFRGEDALTSALIRIRQGKRPRVGFITGHGEPSIHETAPGKAGVGLLVNRLGAIGIDVFVHNLARDVVPAGTDAIFLIAPKTAFDPREANRLKAYVQGGGHVIVLDDGRQKTGLVDWLATFNIEFGPGLIVDPDYNFFSRKELPAAQILGDISHPVVEALRNQAVIVPLASPLAITGGGPMRKVAMPKAPNPEYVATPILRTSPQSWAETEPLNRRVGFDAQKDTRGPLVVAAAVTTARSAKGGDLPVLVVFSSPLMAFNDYVAYDQANLDILVNALGWLRGRPDTQGLSPRRHVALTLAADPVLRQRLILLPTVLAAALVLGIGVSVFMARRA
jgi:hypothetical protein